MSGWHEAVQAHIEYAIIEIDALKSLFDEGDEERPPDAEYEKLEEIEGELKALWKHVGK